MNARQHQEWAPGYPKRDKAPQWARRTRRSYAPEHLKVTNAELIKDHVQASIYLDYCQRHGVTTVRLWANSPFYWNHAHKFIKAKINVIPIEDESVSMETEA